MNSDVLVVGGGTGGVPAAVAAAREGARTLLVERYGFLGGMATAGLVNPFMGYWLAGKPITRGVFAEILDHLRDAGGLAENGQTFDEEILKIVLDEMVRESGVDVLFHTTFVDCQAVSGTIKDATFVSKGGPFHIEAKVYVDASGDADLAAAAGAAVEVGRSEDGLCQPMTLCFRVAGIDLKGGPETHGGLAKTLTDLYIKAKADGRIDNPREDILLFATLRPGVIHFNTTRVLRRSPIDPAELSEAEFEGRRQAKELVDLFRSEAPAFRNAYLEKSGVLIGVRESRRVMGDYVLHADDVLSARKFPDAIACSRYPIDIHNPSGTGTVLKAVPEGDWYEIPYRAIVPSDTSNLIIAGRSISATHEAHSSLRVMPVVAAIGEAAGTAAAMAAAAGTRPSDVDTRELRKRLRDRGAFVGEAR